MKKIILLLLLTVIILTSSAQKLRLYKDCDFWIKNQDTYGEIKSISIKLIWRDDNDSPTNLVAVFYPHKRVIIDESPEFQGISDGFPYYYFTATENKTIPLTGTIVQDSDGNFSISLIYSKEKIHSAVFYKNSFKYIPITKQYEIKY